MSRTVGVVMTSHIVAGIVEENELAGPLRSYPDDPHAQDVLMDMPVERLCDRIAEQVEYLSSAGGIEALGVAMAGILHNGVVENSPNLPQLKGANIHTVLAAALRVRGIELPIKTCNNADAVATGLAAMHNSLDRVVRVWTLGNGIGFGRYPSLDGIWEGGHTVVTLDLKETYCGCGGLGHLEGIMGFRAMRRRFLDMEPEEVFANARKGDARCSEFVRLWHRALAAATATSIHLDGPGPFYFTGFNIGFLDLALLKQYLWDMVKMSPLQSYTLEVIQEDDSLGIIGAARAGLAI